MSERDAVAACLTVLGDRYAPIWNQIGSGPHAADLGQHIQKLADDLMAALQACGELTDERKAKMNEIPAELTLAEKQRAEKDDFRLGQFYQRAMGCITAVQCDCFIGPKL